jgi:uncharacterized protein (DUF885 family)
MKIFFKWIGLTVLVVILLSGLFAAHEWNAEKPFSFRLFLDRTIVKVALNSPQTLTSLGILENLGMTGHNANLDDASLASMDKMFANLHKVKTTMSEYADEDLTEDELLSKEIAMYLLNLVNGFEQFRFHNYPFNQMSGAQSNFPSFMDAQHAITDVASVDNYISRLSQSQRFFEQQMEGLRLREQKDIIPPRFVIERVIDEMTRFISKPAIDNVLYTSAQTKIEASIDIPEEQQNELLSRIEFEIVTTVYPTYQDLIDYFTQLLPKAGNDDGLWRLPDGDQAYRLALQFFTTTDYSAQEIHLLGLSEVDRIQAEIMAILAAEDYDTSAGFSAAIANMSEQADFYYSDDDAGRTQILEDYQVILDEIDAGLGDAFFVRPKAGMEVVRIPLFKEKTAPGAYYQQPSLDGTRPGRFFANLYDIKATPKYSMRTLAYHEGIPGHHFQVAISMELEGLPIFRTISPFTAYVEGWALYAEYLAWELGFQSDPFDNIGRLQAELFRAVRLVVDTGIHAKRWTREQAIDYMLANTGMAESDVISEIERYIVIPGQATSYKIGMMKILDVRSKAQQALGDAFSLGEFHDVVLKNGAVPLDILERLVDQYIATKLADIAMR